MEKKKEFLLHPKYILSDFIRLNGGLKYRIFCYPKVHYEDGATLKTKGRVIVTCNHNSFIEVPIMYGTFLNRRIFFIIAKELNGTKLNTWFYKNMNCISIDRYSADIKALKQAIKTLKNEHLLVIFPEGAMSEDGTNQDFKNGAALLSLATNTPILPLYIQNKLNKKDRKHLCVGKMIYPCEVTDGKKNKENIEKLTKVINEKTFELKEKLNIDLKDKIL